MYDMLPWYKKKAKRKQHKESGIFTGVPEFLCTRTPDKVVKEVLQSFKYKQFYQNGENNKYK